MGPYNGPGISIKLSALHPRYTRSQIDRVMAELLPRVTTLAGLARRYDIGLNIDAEEADRLELSLDLLEALCLNKDLRGWNGLGFVVQAYQKRCPFVIDFIIDLAQRSGRRVMVRLVKGAYWDSEIKRAQVDGLEDFPVFTRKIHTDVSYLACARKLLSAPDAVYPQFATHNAHTLATIMQMAGNGYVPGQYEFQCLHGMGEPLYEQVVGPDQLDRPCRIYAPVGTHETLLAYLVRRLLENGANSSFVNRIGDLRISTDELIADPVAAARDIRPVGAPHPKIAPPRALFGSERMNSAGIDLSNEDRLAELSETFAAGATINWKAAPLIGGRRFDGEARQVRNPADRRDIIGSVIDATPAAIAAAFDLAAAAAPRWAAVAAHERAGCLDRAALGLESRMPVLLDLIIREAGKSVANAVAEVREAIDFLRYYAAEIRRWPAAAPADSLGPGGLHQPVEFSAGDLYRPGRRRSCRRQSGAGETRRRNAADCRGGDAHHARRRHPDRCPAFSARRRPRRRGAGLGRQNRCRDVHGLDRSRAIDPRPIGRPAVARRPHHPADCRDRRHQCDGGGFIGARRAGCRATWSPPPTTARASAVRRCASFACRTRWPTGC